MKKCSRLSSVAVVIGAFRVKQPLAKTVMIHVYTFFSEEWEKLSLTLRILMTIITKYSTYPDYENKL